MRRVHQRRLATAGVLAFIAAGCATAPEGPDRADSADGDDGGSPAAAPAAERDTVREESIGCDPGELYWLQEGCEPATSIDLDEVWTNGPPPDGIPPIDEPVYEPIDHADDWLNDDSPVLVVEVGDDVRAYPLAILTWHEIVNTTVGGEPLAVTYCPLCNSALVFERTIDGPDGREVLDFGTSGRLYQSNLLMYDRTHHDVWLQFSGESVVGDATLGTRLERVPAWLLGYDTFVELHPDAQVLSRDTGFVRDYGSNPYELYDTEEGRPFLFDGDADDRFPPMKRFVGVADDGDAVAVELDHLGDERVVEVTVGGRDVAVVWAPGQASALDTADLAAGREVGQTAVFDLALDDQRVELEPGDADGVFVDAATGTTFDLRGRAVSGPLAGRMLSPVPHDDTLWFAWAAFHPETEVIPAVNDDAAR